MGTEYTTNVLKTPDSYFKANHIITTSSYKIPAGSEVNVVYITNTGTKDVTFTIKGLRLNKYQY